MYISFIVPAYNEERSIGALIDSICLNVPSKLSYEVIVVDNNSSDNTAKVAKERGAHVIVSGARTIAELRNLGVSSANGEIIIFLDADIELTPEWKDNIASVLEEMKQVDYQCIAGSHCVPLLTEKKLISRCWFNELSKNNKSKSIGSAHMIISKQYFMEVGGFNQHLITGEDYDLCVRVKNIKGKLLITEKIKVVHKDYPISISSFFRREMWHGAGDYISITGFITSTVAVLSQIILLLTVLSLIGALLGVWYLAFLSVSIVLFILIVSVIKRFSRLSNTCMLYNVFLSYVYFIARSMSVYSTIVKTKGWK